MQSVNNPVELPAKPTETKPDWHERLASFTFWFGIAGMILLISRGVWADNKPGSLPGARPFVNPLGGDPMGSPGRGISDDDDFDDDDDEDYIPPPAHKAISPSNSLSASNTPKSFSAGGTPSSGPNPTITDKGIQIGGAAANGVIPKAKPAPLIKIDDDTAEGSKAMVTDFNFPDADILDIAKTLGKLTGKNFILDKDVKGKITIISNSPITVSDAWKAFLTALDINGFALIPSGKYIRIARQRDARDKQLKTYTGEVSPDTDALITRVFPLKYINAEEVSRTFRSFVPANARIIPYEQTNTVIVTDTGSNITKLSKMLEILDVEGFDAGIEVIPVKYASAVELSKLIDALIPGTGSPGSGGSPGGAPRFGGGTGKFSARRTKEGGIINTIIADERTNTLIVHANAKGADQVRELVAKLDQRHPAATGGGKVHVVYLQFADAEQVANTLNAFSSQASTAAKPAGTGSSGGSPSGVGTNPVESNLFQGTIKISPDKATNALVITASPADFVTVKRVIDRLDILRDQVYVEIVIMEVNVSRGFNYSANVLNAPMTGYITNKDDIAALFSPTGPFSVEGAIIPLQTGGQTNMSIGGVSYPIASVQGLIKVLQSTGNSNVLATPQIIALDNTEANFESVEKVPTLSTNSVQGVGVQQSVTFQNIAISIKIKPQINKATNFVKLDITAKLGDISNRVPPAGVATIAVGTTERNVQTTVMVGDTDTVVLGGLIRDKISESVKKIPILGDIPLLGWLFKSRSTSADKTNLLVFMTPHIIRKYEKIRAILDKKLKERDEFIESNAGGEDALRPTRDAIIRSLPDLKELTENKPANTFTIDDDKLPTAAVEVKRPASGEGNPDSTQLNPEGRVSTPTAAPVVAPSESKAKPVTPSTEKPSQ